MDDNTAYVLGLLIYNLALVLIELVKQWYERKAKHAAHQRRRKAASPTGDVGP